MIPLTEEEFDKKDGVRPAADWEEEVRKVHLHGQLSLN